MAGAAMKKDMPKVPRLRFPEFDGEWTRSRLKNIASIERGRFSPRPRNDPAYYGGDIPFVQTSDVVNSNGVIAFFSQTLNEKGLKVSKLFPKGTILITIAANIGYTGILQTDMACPDSLIGIRCKNGTDNLFLNIYLSTQQKYMEYIAPEGAQKNINIDFLEPYKIPRTSLPEQQKIASFLSAVDKKIQQLSRKKELLEQYKKGVMQKIFSQEIRFKDENGQEYPPWQEKRLGDVGNFYYGKSAPKFSISEDAPTPCVRYGELYSTYREEIRSIVSRTNIPPRQLKFSKGGEILIPRVGEDPLDFANCSLLTLRNVAIGEMISVLETQENGLYLVYYINSQLKKEFAKVVEGGSVANLYFRYLQTIKISIPSVPEQQKIASFLKNIDKKIESINTQLTQTQAFKKGLLQQMFV